MIIYFSGTGNSRYIAKELSIYLKDNDLVDINNRIKTNNLSSLNVNNNSLIVVSPTYAWRIPRILNDYLKKIKINNAKGIYFVLTCGGEIGNAYKYNKILADSLNIKYLGTTSILLPDSYIIMFKEPTLEDAIKLINPVKEKIIKIGNVIKENKEFIEPHTSTYDHLKSGVINSLFYKLYIKGKGFRVNKDICNGCGKCVKLCSLNNIKLVDNKPSWGNNCTHCMACISYCPVRAIDYKRNTKNKTPYNIEKYLNPSK